MRKLAVIIVLGGLAFSGVAAGQAKPGGGGGGSRPSVPTAPIGGFGGAGPAQQFRNDIITQAWTYHLTRLTGYKVPPEVDRANRVAALIDKGQCHDAEALAVAEHDTQMAEKVPAVCRAKTAGKL